MQPPTRPLTQAQKQQARQPSQLITPKQPVKVTPQTRVVTIGGKQYDYGTYKNVWNLIIKRSEGRKTPLYGMTPQEKQLYSYLSRQPDIKRAIQRGTGAKMAAREAGFASTQQFIETKIQLGLGLTEREAALFEGGSAPRERIDDVTIITQAPQTSAEQTFDFKQYAEKFGRPQKQQPTFQEVIKPQTFDFKQKLREVQPPKKFDIREQSREFGRPSEVTQPFMDFVDIPPTQIEEVKKAIRERGAVRGTLWYGGQKVSGILSEGRFSPFKGSGRSRSIGRLGSLTTEIAPYFTPAGPALLVGAGAEELVTPRGREMIKEKELSFEEEGFSPVVSSVFAWGEPLAEVTLGGFGLSSQIKGAIQTTKLKGLTPKTTFKAETQSLTGDIEGISIISRTKLGEFESVGIGGTVVSKTGPSFFASKGYITTEELITPVRSVGIGSRLGQVKSVKVIKPVTIKKPVGRGFKTETTTFADEQKMSSKIIGSVTKGDSASYVLAGKPKLRLGGGEARTIFRPTIVGKITKAKPDKVIREFTPFGKQYLGVRPKVKVPKQKPIVKTKELKPQELKPQELIPVQEQAAISLVSGLERQAKVSIIQQAKIGVKAKVVPPSGVSLVAPIVKTTQKSEQAVSSALSSASLESLKSKQTLKQIDKVSTIPTLSLGLVPAQVPREKQRLFTPSISKQVPRQQPRPRGTPPVSNFFFAGEPSPPKPTPKIPLIPIPKRDKLGRQQLYEGYVKEKGKWKKKTKPVPIMNAWSTSSEIVDREISAQFRVKPAQKTIAGKKQFVYGEVSKFPKPSPHWKQNKQKFRQFTSRKGQKTKIFGGVERQTYRLDSPTEVRKIQRSRNVRNLFGF